MASQESTPLKAASRNLLVAAAVLLIAVGAATAFAVGYSDALEDGLASPSSAPAQRITALESLRDALGSDGFLKTYREGAEATRIAASVRRANSALAQFGAAAETERDEIDGRALAALVAPFDRAARDRLAGIPSPDPALLERAYSALKLRIASAIDSARYRRIETLGHAFATAQTIAVLALAALSLTLFGLAWFIRSRLLEPLRELRRSAEKAADGGLFRHLWGIERNDEIGALARAANRLRRQLAFEADETASPSGEIRAVLENRSYHPALTASASTEVVAAAGRIESDLAAIVAAVGEAKERIEAASRDAALASRTAVEAANLAREGTTQLTVSAERAIAAAGNDAQSLLAALTASVARLNQTAARLDAASVAIVPIRDGREPKPAVGRDARTAIGSDSPQAGQPPSQFGRRDYDAPRAIPRRIDGPAPQAPAASARESRRSMRDALWPMRGGAHVANDSDGPFSARSVETERERVEADLYAALARLATAKQESDHEPHDASLLAGLSAELDSLEAMTRPGGALENSDAPVVTAALIEAIDRLNGVVERVAATMEKQPVRGQY
jgi:HAMP domain-containing protein